MSGSGAAGAGSRITGTPASAAIFAARKTVFNGVSNCNTSMSAAPIRSACLSTSSGVSDVIRPGGHGDEVLAGVIDEDQGHAGGVIGAAEDAVGDDALAAVVLDRLVAEHVLADLGHQRHFGAEPCGGDGLVGPLCRRRP